MNERRKVRKIGSIMSQLMSRRGYAQVLANEELQAALVAAVGPDLAASVRAGNVRGGVLSIYASDSVTLQELNFQKRVILKRIQADVPQSKISDVRFRIQSET